MRVEYTLTQDDMLSFTRHYMSTHPSVQKSRLAVLLFCSAALLGVIVLTLLQPSAQQSWIGFIAICTLIV